MPETALITQKNQPHAARTTALLLSCHPFLPFLTSPQLVRKSSLAGNAERRDAGLAVIGRRPRRRERKDHARAVAGEQRRCPRPPGDPDRRAHNPKRNQVHRTRPERPQSANPPRQRCACAAAEARYGRHNGGFRGEASAVRQARPRSVPVPHYRLQESQLHRSGHTFLASTMCPRGYCRAGRKDRCARPARTFNADHGIDPVLGNAEALRGLAHMRCNIDRSRVRLRCARLPARVQRIGKCHCSQSRG